MPDYPFDCAEVLKNRRALKKKLLQRDDLLERRIALLSGSTVGVLKDLLEIFLLDWGIRPVFFEGAYGRFYEDAVFDEGALARFKPDVLYIHTSVRDIELPRAGESAADCDARLDTVFGRFREIWDGVGDKLGCAVIQNNFDFPRLRVMGNYEATAYSGKLRFVNRLNERFACYADTHRNFYINDLCWLSAFYGLDRFSDPTAYNAYKYAVAPESMPLLAHSIASIIKAL
ncbi:MAG: HAD family hydrolase, partial [Oscillospiraceae bacterium]